MHSSHISTRDILLCVKMGSMNGFIIYCSSYLFSFHIINQTGDALLASQSEKVTSSSQFLVVNNPTDLYRSHGLVSFNRLICIAIGNVPHVYCVIQAVADPGGVPDV